jgi:hypothetical protein
MYQLYRMERRKNGEYILKYVLSAQTMSEIDIIATKWSREGHLVTWFPAPIPGNAWKTDDDLVKEYFNER